MAFINPLEILDLANLPAEEINSDAIKRAKRALLNEIELADDNAYHYKGVRLSKGDCEKVISQLENREDLDSYHFLAANPNLTNFLVSGQTAFFTYYRAESIYGLPVFVNLISAEFAEQYDKALCSAFAKSDANLLRKILSVSPIVKASDRDQCYHRTSKLLGERIAKVDEMSRDIKSGDSIFSASSFAFMIPTIKETLKSSEINSLPVYFQASRNKAAMAIRNVSVDIWNEWRDGEMAEDLLHYAQTFKIDGITETKLQQDFDTIHRLKEEQEQETREAGILNPCYEFVTEVGGKLEAIENKLITPNAVLSWVNQRLNIIALNSVSEAHGEMVSHVALVLRALSVAVFNTYDNLDVSIQLVSKATQLINVSTDNKAKVLEAFNELNQIKQRRIRLAPSPRVPQISSSTSSTSTSSQSKTNTTSSSNKSKGWLEENPGCAVIVGSLAFIGIGYAAGQNWMMVIGVIVILIALKSIK